MEFHLNPTQVGVSNDRPRYYLVAILQNVHLSSSPSPSRNNVSQRLWTITSKGYTQDQEQPSGLTNDNIQIYTSLPLLHTMDDNGTQQQQQQLPTIELYLDDDLPPKASNDFINEEKLNALRVPRSTIMKSSSWCFDIVTASDQRSSCFTSSYSRMNRGTGSILYHGDRLSLAVGGPDTDAKASKIIKLCDPSERQYDPKWWHVLLDHDDDCRELNNENDIKQLPLRYFSQTEMARLMGFPLKCDYGDARSYKSSEEVDGDTSSDSGFGFPPWCTHKQSYRLLGNSINVSLSARLCQLAISEYVDDFHRGDQSES
jgi:site-specific DNA-cytosine methylase